MMQFTLRSDALYGIRLISFTKIDKWSILVKEMRGEYFGGDFFGLHFLY